MGRVFCPRIFVFALLFNSSEKPTDKIVLRLFFQYNISLLLSNKVQTEHSSMLKLIYFDELKRGSEARILPLMAIIMICAGVFIILFKTKVLLL